MPIWTQILIALIALEHLWILVLEMFLWDKPQGMKTFNTTPQSAAETKVMAGNQGLYNGFLAIGLLWSLFPIGLPGASQPLATFFLLCVLAAGLYGALTVSRRILYVQAAPALVALVLVWAG